MTGADRSNAGFWVVCGNPAITRSKPNGLPVEVFSETVGLMLLGRIPIGLFSFKSPSTKIVNTAVRINAITTSRVPTKAIAKIRTCRKIEFVRYSF